MSARPPRSLLEVRLAKPRDHMPRILELEQTASADRTKVYDGFAWNNDVFREYLRKGTALVVFSRERNVIGFACYHLSLTAVEVAKLVSQIPIAEESLLYELYNIQMRMHKVHVNLPMILSFGA